MMTTNQLKTDSNISIPTHKVSNAIERPKQYVLATKHAEDLVHKMPFRGGSARLLDLIKGFPKVNGEIEGVRGTDDPASFPNDAYGGLGYVIARSSARFPDEPLLELFLHKDNVYSRAAMENPPAELGIHIEPNFGYLLFQNSGIPQPTTRYILQNGAMTLMNPVALRVGYYFFPQIFPDKMKTDANFELLIRPFFGRVGLEHGLENAVATYTSLTARSEGASSLLKAIQSLDKTRFLMAADRRSTSQEALESYVSKYSSPTSTVQQTLDQWTKDTKRYDLIIENFTKMPGIRGIFQRDHPTNIHLYLTLEALFGDSKYVLDVNDLGIYTLSRGKIFPIVTYNGSHSPISLTMESGNVVRAK